MSTFWLKIIAIVTMAVDHIGAILFPQVTILRVIGRIAFPIFAFLLVEGLTRTRSLEKYLMRMLLFAVLSELPFDLAFWGKAVYLGHQNVMWTFSLVLVAIYLYRRLPAERQTPLAFWGLAMLFAVVASYLRTDYGAWGVIWVMSFFAYRDQPARKYGMATFLLVSYGLLYTALSGRFFWEQYIECCAALSFPCLLLFNGRKGPALKYFFYAFYPAHLLLLWLWARVL